MPVFEENNGLLWYPVQYVGMAYVFNKKIEPIAIENRDYRDLLKGIFTTNNRLASIYNDEDIVGILSLFSNNILKINNCVKDIISSVSIYKESSCKPIDKDIEIVNRDRIKENYIEELIMTGQVNINECIFFKYMLDRRKYKFEWALKKKIEIEKFTNWIDENFYGVESDIEGDVQQVYEDIISHFCKLELLDKCDILNEESVELYEFKPEYAKQLILFNKKNPKLIDDECYKQNTMPF